MNTIRIACDVKDHISIDELEPFQGDLKSLSQDDFQKLRKEILETGFAFPIIVWTDEDGRHNVVGGHQRLRVLKQLRDSESYVIPPVPVVKVEADSIATAKRRVLQDVGQYGKIEREGLYQFMVENSIDPGDIASSFRLPDVDLKSFNAEFFLDDVGAESEDAPDGAKEIDANEFKNFDHQCPRCGFNFNSGESGRDAS